MTTSTKIKIGTAYTDARECDTEYDVLAKTGKNADWQVIGEMVGVKGDLSTGWDSEWQIVAYEATVNGQKFSVDVWEQGAKRGQWARVRTNHEAKRILKAQLAEAVN